MQLQFAVPVPSWRVPKAAEMKPYVFSICSKTVPWSCILVNTDGPVDLKECSVHPETWKFGDSVESITVTIGNICKVTHTHTIPMHAPEYI